MEGTGKMLDYTAHMYSSQDKTSTRRRQAKWYAPYPPWLVLPVSASELTCRRRQRDTEALRLQGGAVPGVRSHRHRGKNTV